MPIYEYACGKCGHEFEVEQRITDAPIKTCPACRSRKARRLISRTSFVLKGSGWYSDLYSSSGGGKGKGEGEGKDAAASSSEGKEKKKSGGSDAGGAGKSGGEKAGGSKDKSKASKAA